MSARSLLGLLVALAALALSAGPAVAGTLVVDDAGVTVDVPNSGHGDVVWPGDSFALTESIQNSATTP